MVLDLRLPRLLVAVFVGASLAVSGTLLQAVVRNPLAAPEILGVTLGAGLVPLAALSGAAIAFAVVYAAAWKQGLSPFRPALVGIAVSAFCHAWITLLVVQADVRVAQALA